MMDKAKRILEDAGYRVCEGASWEDSRQIFVSSVECDRRCYNHPMFEVQYNKETGWLSVTGRKPEMVAA